MCLISWCCPRLLLRRDTVYMPCYLSIIRNTLNFKRKLVPWVSDKGMWGSRNSNLSIHLPSSAVWAPNHYVLFRETNDMGNVYNSSIQVFINYIPCTSHTDKIAIVTSTREENWCQKRLNAKGIWPEWSEAVFLF